MTRGSEKLDASGDKNDYRLARKAALARYGFAVVAASSSLATALVLLTVTDVPVYAVVVGAVAVTVWYGGFGPGLVAVTVGWGLSFVFFVGDVAAFDLDGDEDLLPWSAGLIVALGIVWVSVVMRRGQERAATAAVAAEESIREVEVLQGLASALSGALTQTDVAHTLIERTPAILGAHGGAVGLVEGEELVIIDPQDVRTQTHPPGLRLSLAAWAPIVRAVVEARPIVVGDRATFEEIYPDGAALTPYAQAAVAVPLRAEGHVVGSMSFLFDRTDVMHEDAEAVAQIAAGLGEQALERARLYERERQSRQALDRILRVAPRFHADTAEDVHTAICREARTTFGAYVAVLWRVREHRLELVWSDPILEPLTPGLEASLEDFPALLEAVERRRVAFVEDIQEESQGEGLERARRLGIRSSLRIPISVAGKVGHVLTISWENVISEPDPTTTVIAQRFADQAGLALEQLARGRAQAEAALRADETRRLQEITAALSLSATVADVSNTCLEHALTAVNAEAGFVVVSQPGGATVELVTSRGYSDAQLEIWRGFDKDSGMPMWRAITSGEPVWALAAEEMAAFVNGKDLGDQGWVSLPLKTTAGVRGALHLSFRRPRELGEDERRWLQAVVSQCAQAFERSRLFDEEQFLRRRSEQLQDMTAALSNALAPSDVAEVAVEQLLEAAGASGTALAAVLEDGQFLRTLAWRGYSAEVLEPWRTLPMDSATPWTRAVRRRVSTFYETLDELSGEFPALAAELGRIEHSSFLFVPLVVGREASGLLSISWAQRHALSGEERRFVESLASQAAQALDRARRFESERTVAETLQQSILPASLPEVRGIELAARYLPGTAELDVGGDWFDAIALQEGRVGLVVGDVVGKGVRAAATMSQLRNGLRAFALDRMKPSSTIGRLNRLAEETFETAFATMVYAVVDRESRICRFTAAGHPPPLIAYPDGRAELLEGGRGLPLGAGPDSKYGQGVVELPIGSVLLLYTDGLVERRDRPIDEGLELLQTAAVEGPRQPEALIEHVLERLIGSGERGDDIAVLAARLLAVAPEPLHLRVPRNVGSLDLVRDSLRTWLEGTPLGDSDTRDVVLATWEACTNAVEHALDPVDDYVTVSAHVTGSAVTVTVEDTGGWAPPVERSDRGLGLRLIHATMSSVDVSTDEGGTRITLEKRFG